MSKTLCVLPFMHLATHPNGLVTPCCIANYENGVSFSRTNGKLLNLADDSIDDIMNSDSFKNIRSEMLNGNEPIECKGCYNLEKQGIESKRLRENKLYLEKMTNFPVKQNKFSLKFIELRLGNVCNLKCLSCNPMSSTKWIEDVKKMPVVPDTDHYNYEEYKNEWYRDIEWYEQLLKHCEELECIYINGGEPTLIKEHFYFLERLIEQGLSKKIELIYNINVTNLPTKFLELLSKFRHVKLQLSIDDLGERNFYIRYPASWNAIENNLKLLENENFDVSITQTISILNICNIKEFQSFFNHRKIPIEYNIVHTPKYLHISSIHPGLKSLAISQIESLVDTHNRDLLMFEINKQPYSSYQTGIKYIKMMDSIRNIDIKSFLEEYAFI